MPSSHESDGNLYYIRRSLQRGVAFRVTDLLPADNSDSYPTVRIRHGRNPSVAGLGAAWALVEYSGDLPWPGMDWGPFETTEGPVSVDLGIAGATDPDILKLVRWAVFPPNSGEVVNQSFFPGGADGTNLATGGVAIPAAAPWDADELRAGLRIISYGEITEDPNYVVVDPGRPHNQPTGAPLYLVIGYQFQYLWFQPSFAGVSPSYQTFLDDADIQAIYETRVGQAPTPVDPPAAPIDYNVYFQRARRCASSFFTQIQSQVEFEVVDGELDDAEGTNSAMTTQFIGPHWLIKIRSDLNDPGADINAGVVQGTEPGDEQDDRLTRWIEECFVHEFAHVAAGNAEIASASDTWISNVCKCFLHKTTGARGSAARWQGGEWANQISEAVAEVIKVHWLGTECRYYGNRTVWKLDGTKTSTFYGLMGLEP